MHEYSIVAALIEQIGAQAKTHHAQSAVRARVRIGALSGVEIPLLSTAWETFRPGTLCADCDLDIVLIGARWECPRCHRTPGTGEVLRCRRCEVPASLVEGDEIILERVELVRPKRPGPEEAHHV